jgi:5-methyltetrahydropteroyltriglutamate--homocysteine methyltransferase
LSDRILTSHAGSLPRPEDLVQANLARSTGEGPDDATYEQQLGTAVDDVVARQKELGIDIVNDGEYGHSMGERYDYGAWWSYVFPRLGGLELDEVALLEAPQARPKPGEVALASFAERRDWQQFSEAYDDPSSGAALPMATSSTRMTRR